MLFLQCCLWQLSLKDEASLFVNVSLHAGKSMGTNERQVCLQPLFIWSICSRNKGSIKCSSCVRNSSAAAELLNISVSQLIHHTTHTKTTVYHDYSMQLRNTDSLKALVCLENNRASPSYHLVTHRKWLILPGGFHNKVWREWLVVSSCPSCFKRKS